MVWKFATSSELKVSFGMNSCQVHRISIKDITHSTADQPQCFLHGEVQRLSELGVFILVRVRTTLLPGQIRSAVFLLVPLRLIRC